MGYGQVMTLTRTPLGSDAPVNYTTLMQFEVSKTEKGVTKVVIGGRLDLDAALKLENPFAFQVATLGGPVVVDLSGVDFLASMGLRLIVKNARAVQGRGGKMVVCSANAIIREAITVSGLNSIIPLFASFEEAADAALAGSAS